MSSIVQRVARRYIKAQMSPEMLWGLWLNVTEKTLPKALAKATGLMAIAKNPKTMRFYVQVKQAVDNVETLDKRYTSKIRAFRNQSDWTPELEQLAEELSNDRQLEKMLRREPSFDPETLFDGLRLYLKQQLENPALYKRLFEHLTQVIHEYVEGETSEEEARQALDEMLKLDFSREQKAIEVLVPLIPELKSKTTPEASNFKYFPLWVRQLDVAFGDEDQLASVIAEWEDAIPYALRNAEYYLDEVDFPVFDIGDDSEQVAWYASDLEKFWIALEDVT